LSLINQVLLDLDRRHAPAGALPLARSVTPLARPRVTWRWVGALLVIGASAGVFVAATRAMPATPLSAIPVTALAPATSVVPLPSPVLESTSLAAANVRPAPTPTVAMAAPSAAAKRAASNALPDDDVPTTVAIAAPAVAPKSNTTPSKAAPLASAPEASVEKRVLALAPRERAEAEYQRGLGLHQQGQAEEARSAFASALREDRRYTSARQAFAVSLLGDGRADEAEAALVQGLEVHPQDALLASTLARIKADRQDLVGAIAVLKAALPASAATKLDAPDARALLATLQQHHADHADAIENYAAALRVAPGNGPWWIGLGVSLAAAGRGESARDAFERARATELTPELARYVEQRLAATPR
jgi:MSHA biogenesis protein MshN